MNPLAPVANIWGGDKNALSDWLGVADDGLHVLVGTGLFIVLAVVTGRRLDDGRLWLIVFLLECANEAVDLSAPDWPEANWSGATHDLILTMVLPTLLLMTYRFTGRREAQAAASTDDASEANSARPSVDG